MATTARVTAGEADVPRSQPGRGGSASLADRGLADALQTFTGSSNLYSFADSLLVPNDVVATTLQDIQNIYSTGDGGGDGASSLGNEADFEDRFWVLFHAYSLPEYQVVRSNEDREKAAFRQIVGLPDELPGHRPLDPYTDSGEGNLGSLSTSQWVKETPQWPIVRGLPATQVPPQQPGASTALSDSHPQHLQRGVTPPPQPPLSGVLSPTYEADYAAYRAEQRRRGQHNISQSLPSVQESLYATTSPTHGRGRRQHGNNNNNTNTDGGGAGADHWNRSPSPSKLAQPTTQTMTWQKTTTGEAEVMTFNDEEPDPVSYDGEDREGENEAAKQLLRRLYDYDVAGLPEIWAQGGVAEIWTSGDKSFAGDGDDKELDVKMLSTHLMQHKLLSNTQGALPAEATTVTNESNTKFQQKMAQETARARLAAPRVGVPPWRRLKVPQNPRDAGYVIKLPPVEVEGRGTRTLNLATPPDAGYGSGARRMAALCGEIKPPIVITALFRTLAFAVDRMHLPALEGQEPSQLCVHDLEWIDTRSPCEYCLNARVGGGYVRIGFPRANTRKCIGCNKILSYNAFTGQKLGPRALSYSARERKRNERIAEAKRRAQEALRLKNMEQDKLDCADAKLRAAAEAEARRLEDERLAKEKERMQAELAKTREEEERLERERRNQERKDAKKAARRAQKDADKLAKKNAKAQRLLEMENEAARSRSEAQAQADEEEARRQQAELDALAAQLAMGPVPDVEEVLLAEYPSIAARNKEFDRITRHFGKDGFIMVLTVRPATKDRVKMLATYIYIEALLSSLWAESNPDAGVRLIKSNAGRFFVYGEDINVMFLLALAARRSVGKAHEMNEIFRAGICVALDYGQVFLILDDAFGFPVNTACKLANDVANDGDFLLEPAVVKLFRACGSDLVDKIKFINGELEMDHDTIRYAKAQYDMIGTQPDYIENILYTYPMPTKEDVLQVVANVDHGELVTAMLVDNAMLYGEEQVAGLYAEAARKLERTAVSINTDMDGFGRQAGEFGLLHFVSLIVTARDAISNAVDQEPAVVVNMMGDNIAIAMNNIDQLGDMLRGIRAALASTNANLRRQGWVQEMDVRGDADDAAINLKIGIAHGTVLIKDDIIIGGAAEDATALANGIAQPGDILCCCSVQGELKRHNANVGDYMERTEEFIMLNPDPDNLPPLRRNQTKEIIYSRLLLEGDDEFDAAIKARRDALEKANKPKLKSMPKKAEAAPLQVPVPLVKRKSTRIRRRSTKEVAPAPEVKKKTKRQGNIRKQGAPMTLLEQMLAEDKRHQAESDSSDEEVVLTRKVANIMLFGD